MPTVYLNIGSNRGDRLAHITKAVTRLAAAWPAAVIRQSPAIETAPWGYESASMFVNVGVAADFAGTTPAPAEILETIHAIERDISPDSPHRNADGTYRDRDIDIDIIDIDGVTMDTPDLTIPHPRAEARRFVMEPMQFLCPGWTATRHESRRKKTVSEMGRMTVDEFHSAPKSPIAVILDNIRSLNNIGSVFRTADAFRVHTVALCGISACPPHPEIHKTALGAEDSVGWRYFATTAEAVAAMRAEGWTIACLEQAHGSIPLDRYTIPEGARTAIVAGNEVTGVDEAVVRDADLCLEIPQSGTKHSLNVAVSTAIALWHLYAATLKR